MEYMADVKTKLELSEILNKIQDGATEQILRHILFDDNNIIDWESAGRYIKWFMPETI